MITSFVATPSESEFSIHNLPYGIFSYNKLPPRVGVAISDHILDLSVLSDESMFKIKEIDGSQVFNQAFLNNFMSLGKPIWDKVRARITELLSSDNAELRDDSELCKRALIPMKQCTLHLPVKVTDYTDFYASKNHAFNVGSMFRGPENALMPNWVNLPVGYHGRASSIINSDVSIHRPKGQSKPGNMDSPIFGPCRNLDFEFEMGFFIGTGNELGKPIPIDNASEKIFGLVIVNDWSARDIQAWEYQPLGPFLAKNFATSISPWVVPLAALEPFKCQAVEQDPQPFEYLREKSRYSYDIVLETYLQTPSMAEPYLISSSNFNHLYWTMEQMVAHHSITGCNLQTGDLLASGTISGPTKESYASLLELTWRGKDPLTFPSGETRRFLEDGDIIVMKAYAKNDDLKIGFGECRAKILPSI